MKIMLGLHYIYKEVSCVYMCDINSEILNQFSEMFVFSNLEYGEYFSINCLTSELKCFIEAKGR